MTSVTSATDRPLGYIRFYDRLQSVVRLRLNLQVRGMLKTCLKFLYTSYQALQAGYVAGVYRNRIVKTVLGIGKVFSNFENATTLQRKQDKVFRGSKVLTRTKHRLVTAQLGKSYSGFLAIC